MTPELETWIAVIERVGFSAAIVGMIAYAIRAVATWFAPLFVKVAEGHSKFLEKQTEATDKQTELIEKLSESAGRMEDSLGALNRAIAVKLDKAGEAYASHVFSSSRLEEAAKPAADALVILADGVGKSAEMKPIADKIKDALRG